MTRALNVHGQITEAAFQAQVVGLARFYGWRLFHAPANRPAGRTGRPQRMAAPESTGFPDLVLVRDVELLFAELKAERGRLGPGQPEWLEDLGIVASTIDFAVERGWPDDDRRPTVEVHLWRPSDWSAIELRLARGRVLQPHPLGAGPSA